MLGAGAGARAGAERVTAQVDLDELAIGRDPPRERDGRRVERSGGGVARRATIMALRRAWSGPAAKRETVARSHDSVPTGPAGGGGGTV
jgi:hypothetical protein